MSFYDRYFKSRRAVPVAYTPKVDHTRLFQGDCLEHLRSIADDSVDTIITDLPYAITRASWDLQIDLDRLWQEYIRVAKPTAPICLFASQPFTSKLVLSQPGMFRHIWYWEKNRAANFFNTGYSPLRVMEEICIFSRRTRHTYNPQLEPLERPYRHTMPLKKSTLHAGAMAIQQTAEARVYRDYTHALPRNVLKYAVVRKPSMPTQKPLDLMDYLVRTFSNSGDVVLDSTMGSGTTGVSAKRLGRRFIGMELDPAHYAIAERRIAETVLGEGL